MIHSQMLSQDNAPASSRQTHRGFRSIRRLTVASIFACGALLASTGQLHWQVPDFDEDTEISRGSNLPSSSSDIKVARMEQPAEVFHNPASTGKNVGSAIAVKLIQASPAPLQPAAILATAKYTPSAEKTEAIVAPAITAALPATPETLEAPAPFEKTLDDIVITKLESGASIPVDDFGMPMFYENILAPDKFAFIHGLNQRKVHKNFGYDQQDIFTGEVPNGAYVLHCQKTEASDIRAMCWREVQTSGQQWFQYRFPRAQLNDWMKIELEVLAAIG